MQIPDFAITKFPGLNTAIKDTRTLKKGVAIDSLNWLTGKFGDHIELRRGTALLGASRQAGIGKVTGLGVGIRYDGTEVPFYSHGQKIKYYDADDDDTHEVGSNLLGAAADGEDVWFSAYQNLAGSMMYCGSPNSGAFKIPLANPGSAVNQNLSSFRFGILRFSNGRSFAGQRNGTTAGNNDKTGLYLSAIDKALLSAYTQTTGEAVGSLGSTHYTGTLAAVSGAKTCMYVAIKEATGETLVDDRNGTLVGNQGSTGTINYATGAYDVTFNHTTVGAVTADYYTEDATSSGVLDFDTSSPGAGKAKIYRQDDGGAFMTVLPFQSVNYSLHALKTWALTLALDDTDSSNLPYRAIGVPYPRAAHETADGILLVDTANPSDPQVRRLEIAKNTLTESVVPTSISDALDLTGHAFDYAVCFRFGDYDLVCLQKIVNGVAETHNSVMYARNVFSGSWDKLDYRASCLAILNGTLIAGDPISNNVFTLFSGFDDDESPIENYWQDGPQNLGTENLKRTHYMRVTGLIQKDQQIKVSLVLDEGSPAEVFTIDGDGDYVDRGINTTIGSFTIGSKVVGGGGEATAHPFDVTFPVHTDKYQYVSARFQALNIGYAAINSYVYRDNRDKGRRSLASKTVV